MAISGTDIRELTDNGLAEAAGLISRREYNLSIVRVRQTAEFLIKSYASERGIAYTSLADTIETLYEQGVINRDSRDAYHNIRIYGNKAVHDGDDDPEDAQKSYYLLKAEVGTFLSRKTVSVDRTPVRVETGAETGRSLSDIEVEIDNNKTDYASSRRADNGSRSRAAYDDGEDAGLRAGAGSRDNPSGSRGPRIPDDARKARLAAELYSQWDDESDTRYSGRRSSERDGERTGSRDLRRTGSRDGRKGGAHDDRRHSNRSGRTKNDNERRRSTDERRRSSGREDRRRREDRQERSSFTVYDLLRILLPVLVILLLIVIIRSFMSARQQDSAVETATVIETTAAPETLEPETTEPETTEPETTEPETTAAIEYRIKADGTNVRYADNQNRIYTQLSKGTAIGTVTPIDGSDYVAFTLDGVNVVIRNDLIEPIQ